MLVAELNMTSQVFFLGLSETIKALGMFSSQGYKF